MANNRCSRSSRRLFYHLSYIRVHSKAAVLVLIWDVLISLSSLSLQYFIIFVASTFKRTDIFTVFNDLYHSVWLLFPVAGLIADTCTGRYRLLIFSIYAYFISWIIAISGYVIYMKVDDYAGMVLFIIVTILLTFGKGGFQSIVIPFNIDQLVGASSDELTAVIYWHSFGYMIRCLVLSIPYCFTDNHVSYAISQLALSGIATIIVIASHHIFKHWLDTTPQITNPIKLIVRVLNYARKNKYPRNRSALTYWEDDYPSRLDLGKEKYGGPFSEEEVEDVKTGIRIIPIFICVIGCTIAWEVFEGPQIALASQHTSQHKWCIVDNGSIQYVVCAFLILVCQLVIYPCFYKYIPSMLKRIGLGLFFALLTSLSHVVIVLLQNTDTSSDCKVGSSMFFNSSHLTPIQYYLAYIPHVLYGITYFFIFVTSLEFTIAQSPRQMRGLMIGLWFGITGIGYIISTNFHLPFQYLNSASLDCRFYYFVAKTVCILVIFISFLLITKQYKLRVRNNIVPVHQIAEEYYERYINQSDEYTSRKYHNSNYGTFAEIQSSEELDTK